MHDSEHDEFVADLTKVHGVRKSIDERASCVSVDARIGQGIVEDGRDRRLNCCGEEASQSSALFLIPDPGIEQFGLGLRSK